MRTPSRGSCTRGCRIAGKASGLPSSSGTPIDRITRRAVRLFLYGREAVSGMWEPLYTGWFVRIVTQGLWIVTRRDISLKTFCYSLRNGAVERKIVRDILLYHRILDLVSFTGFFRLVFPFVDLQQAFGNAKRLYSNCGEFYSRTVRDFPLKLCEFAIVAMTVWQFFLQIDMCQNTYVRVPHCRYTKKA